MKQKTIIEIISLLFVILFLYTGISKLMEYPVFKEQISSSPLLEPLAPIVGWALPLAELVAAALLFWPPWRRTGLYAAFGLMTLFTVYVIYIMARDEKLPCSCGGIIELLSWKGHFFLNCILTVLALAGILLSRRANLVTHPILK
jgi:uncharacterized membrane protein YphA (DoxX/SURF4 family)